ncbi:hypothetical protein [Enhygromyxa salina]|nr:hypothetical protein [Enhygromyxa salina]
MPDPSSPRPSASLRVARGAALACSLGLGLLVVVNAQFGCDSPTATPPEKEAPALAPDSKPAAAAASELTPPAAVNAAPAPAEADPEQPTAKAAAKVDAKPEREMPVLMPASKSGGDFGAMRFPGEQAPTQQQNPAPQAQK